MPENDREALNTMAADWTRDREELEAENERLRQQLEVCREDRAFKHRQAETPAARADAAVAEAGRRRTVTDEMIDRAARVLDEKFSPAFDNWDRAAAVLRAALEAPDDVDDSPLVRCTCHGAAGSFGCEEHGDA